MDWSGLLLLTLLGNETEARVTSVLGNVLDQLNISLRPFNYGHINGKQKYLNFDRRKTLRK
jgi:hypothetical protein